MIRGKSPFPLTILCGYANDAGALNPPGFQKEHG